MFLKWNLVQPQYLAQTNPSLLLLKKEAQGAQIQTHHFYLVKKPNGYRGPTTELNPTFLNRLRLICCNCCYSSICCSCDDLLLLLLLLLFYSITGLALQSQISLWSKSKLLCRDLEQIGATVTCHESHSGEQICAPMSGSRANRAIPATKTWSNCMCASMSLFQRWFWDLPQGKALQKCLFVDFLGREPQKHSPIGWKHTKAYAFHAFFSQTMEANS